MTRCFLVGAGASRAIGQTFGVQTALNTDFFAILGNNDGIAYGNIERILQAQFPEIQSLRTLTLEQAEDYIGKTGKTFRNQVELQMKRAIHLLLGKYTNTTDPNILRYLTSGRTDRPNLQLCWLIADNLSRDDFFVILNYDILFELGLLSRGWDIYYGSPYNFLERPIRPLRTDTNPIQVYKPHGSLNWRDNNMTQTYVVDPTEISIGTRLTVATDKRLQGIWKQATDALRSASELVVIGSSLSQEDKQLGDFLKLWKDFCAESAKRTTKIVCQGEELKSRCEAIFDGHKGKLDYWTEGFSEKSLEFIVR